MATDVAIVSSLEGKFFAKDQDGNVVELKNGDTISKDMTVFGDKNNPASANIKFVMNDGANEIVLTGTQEQAFDSSLNDEPSHESGLSKESIEKALIKELYAQEDKTDTKEEDLGILDETAAGEEQAKQNEGGEGQFVDRDAIQTDVTTKLRSNKFELDEKPQEVERKLIVEQEEDGKVVDTTATGAPTVTITEDTNNDGSLVNSEISGDTDISIALPAGALAGDTLNVTIDGVTTTVTITDAMITAKVYTTSVTTPAEGVTLNVSATITDQAGNTSTSSSDSATRADQTATGAPTVTITEDTNNDGSLVNSEISGDTDISIALPAGALAGDTLNVTIDGVTTTVTITDAMITAKVYTTSVTTPAEGVTLNVSATITDQAGNTSTSSSDSATRADQTATGAPTVTITEDTNNDGSLVNSEISGDTDISIALPAGALAGDTLNVTIDGVTTTVTITDAMITAKVYTTSVTTPAEGVTLNVSATITDQAGNTSTSSSDSATRADQTATGAPTVTITEDTNNDGSLVNSEISGDTDISIALPAGALAGDTLNVTIDGVTTTVTITDAMITAKVYTTSVTTPAEGVTLNVSATITDQAGNTSTSSSDSATRADQTATGAPTVTITEDTNNDGSLVNSEISGDTDISIALPAGALAGDTLNVTIDGVTTTVTITDAMITAKVYTTSVTTPAEGVTLNVSATITDQAGNTSTSSSDSATRADQTATGAPTVTITEDTNNDGSLVNSEISGDTDISIALPAGALAGDTLNVTIDGVTTTVTITDAMITAKVYTTSVTTPAEGVTLNVSATITDQAGNTSTSSSDSATRADQTATGAPTVTITEDTNNDGSLVNSEISGDTDISIALPAGALAGDTLNVTIDGVTTTVTITDAMITAKVYTTSVTTPAEGVTLNVSATITDQAGNTSTSSSDSATRADQTATGAPTVTITEDTNNDGSLVNSEISGDTDISIALPAGALAGDTLNVTIDGVTTTVTITDAMITAKVYTTSVTTPAEGVTLNVSATITDQAGNTSTSSSDSATRADQTATGAPTVTITEDTNNDGSLVNSEISGDTDISIALPAGALAGDTLNVTIDGVTTTVTITDAMITAKVYTTSVTTPAEGVTLNVSATITDQAGNTSTSSSDSATRADQTATGAPTVTITEDTNNDGSLVNSEISGDTDISIALPAGALAGDTLNVTIDGVTTTVTITDAMITAKVYTTSVTTPAEGVTLNVSATITDQAGNTSTSSSDSATRADQTATGAPTVTITEDTNNDGSLVNSEISGDTDISIALPAGALAGDTLNVTIDGVTTTVTITDAMITAKVYTTSVTTPAEGVTLNVSATITDQAGNTSTSSSDSATRADQTATGAPTVTITEDTNNDGSLVNSEISGDTDISIALPAGALAGDTLNVTIDGVTTTVTITDAMITAKVYTTSVTTPAEGVTLNVSATITDQAGNTSTSSSDSATRADQTATGAPTVTITEDTNNDGSLVNSEISGDTDISIALPAGALAGDTLNVTIDGVTTTVTITDAMITAKVYTTSVTTPAEGVTLNVSATITDQAGNTSTSSSDSATRADQTATGAPTVTITEDTNNDGSLVNSEISGDTDISIALPAGALAGDTLNVTIDGVTTTVTITDAMITAKVYTTSVTTPAEGVTLNVSATITDQAGNTSTSSSDSATRADQTATGAPTVTITEDTNNDGSLVNSEISGDTDISIALPAGALAGDTLNVTIDGVTTTVTITDAMITAKVYTTSVTTPAEGVTLNVSATITDQAGNTSTSSSDSATRADQTATGAPTVTITEDTNNDGSLVNSEISGDTDISIALPAGALAGDTLNVTIDGVTTTVTITDAMITAKVYTTSVTTPAEGVTLNVSATITDQAGNTSTSSSDSATRADQTATGAPTVTITEDTNNDGSLVNSEISGDTDISIALPAGALAGDTLNVTIDGVTTTVTITDAMITAKVYTTSVTTPAEGVTLNVSATITDQAGNTSTSSSDSATRADQTATGAPTVTITEDTNNDGSLVNSEISGDTDISIALPAGALAGDTLNVTIDGVTTTVTITDAMITAKVYTTSVTTPAEGVTLNVSATITDQAGNTSTSSSDSATRADQTATGAPTVTITEDTNNDGSLVNSEISGDTDISIALPAGALAGDTLNVTIDGVTTTVTITDAMITAKVYTTSVTTPAEGVTLNVSATITDQAGNTSTSSSDSATRADQTATGAPTVTITEDTNNDGSLVNSEISGDTDISIALPAGALAGDTLNVTIDGVTTTVTITDAMITAKVYTTSVTTPAEGVTLNVSATITDQAGNTSTSSSDSATRADQTATGAPTVTITEDTNNDGSLVNSEISGDTDISIALPAGALAGDTLNVTIDGVTTTVTITDAMITAKVYTTSVTTPAEGVTLNVSATITDQAGNTSTSSSDSATRADQTATGAPTVTITEDTNNDGSLVNSEISGDTDISIALPAGALAGDTLNVTIDGVTTTVTITDAMITAKVYTTSVTTPAEGVTLNVSATITDQAGNTSTSSSDSATRADQTATGAPTVTITEDTNNDGSLVNSEISGDTDISIALPAGALAGDTLNVTIDGVTTTVTITDAMITAKVYTTSVTTPAEGVTLNVSATITDQAGNTSTSSSDSATRADQTATGAPTVTITEDTNNDGSLVNSEISGDTDISIALPAGALAGDTLNVTIDGVTTTVTITDAMITAKVYTTSVTTPAEGVTLNVSATITDQAGNTSTSSSDSATRADQTATGAPTVTITEDTNNDGSLVNSEISGDTDISIALPAGALAGDTLNVTIDGVTTTVTITDAMITAKVYTTSVTTPAEGVTLNVSATITDQAGNTSTSSSDSATRADQTATGAPTVTITEDTNNDGSLVNSEISGDTDISIALPAGALAGDTLNVTIDGVTTTVTITDAMITAKVYTTSVTTPAEGVTLNVSATITDQAGNTSTSSSDSATRADQTATGAPTVTITEDTNNDGSLVNSEISGDTDISIALPAGALAGDTLNVTIDGVTTTVTITDAMITAKVYTTSVTTPAEGVTLNVSATITDQAGNTSTSSSDSATRADQTATGAPTVTITEDTNNDGSLVNSEISGDTDISIALPAGALAGDTLNVTIDGVTTTVTITDAMITAKVYTTSVTTPAEGVTLNVSATITDQAGNTSTSSSDSATRADQTATGAPTVTITEDTNNDGSLVNSEISGDTDISIALPAGALAGDTLNVTIDGVTTTVTITDAMITAKVYTTSVTTPAEGVTLNVSATITDQAGNTSTSSSDSATRADQTATGAPTVTITEDTNNDGSLVNSEISGDTDISIALPAGALAGDTLNVTIDGVTTTVTITDAMITAKVYTTSVTTPAEGVTLNVSATITDQAGNTSTSSSDSATRADQTATGAPTVTITEDTNNDGSLVNSEISGDTDISIALPAGALAGDTLNVTIDGVTTTVTITDAMITAKVYTTSVTTPAEGVTLNVSATITDQAGNTSTSSSDSATRADQTATGAPTVTITEDTNNDGSLVNSEISGDTDISIALPAGALAGDTLNVTIDGVTTTVTITDAMITAKVYTTSVTTPAEGVTLNVSATITDQAGNTSTSSSDSATRADQTATGAPTVTITEDTNNDGSLVNSEISGDTDISIALPAGALAGDTLNVTIDGVTTTVTITDAMITAKVYTTSVTTPAEGVTLNVSATITDQAGNTSTSSSDSATRADQTATGAPTVTITEDTNNDGSLVNSEISGDTDISIALPAGALAGDTLNVTIDGVTTTVTITDAMITAKVYTTSVTTPAEGVTLNVSATITDQAGNTSTSSSDSATRADQTATGAPTVTITEDTNNDGSLVNSEISGDTDISIALPAGALAGDTLNVTIDGVTTTVTITDAMITAKVYTTSVTTPAEGVTLNVSATITDQAGNTSTSSSDSVTRNCSPEAQDSNITLNEDTTYTYKLSDFNHNDVDGDAISIIRIESLPTLGDLYYNGILVSSPGLEIDASNIGLLTYKPYENDSGSDDYSTQGVGEQQSDYANFNFSVNDGDTWSNSVSVMTVDVTAVADAPTLDITSATTTNQLITMGNVNTTNNGFEISAKKADGSDSTISINQQQDGFGVKGSASGADSELGHEESLVVKFDTDVSSIDVSFSWKHSSETARITFYKDGVVVGTATHKGGSNGVDAPVTFKPDNGAKFDKVVFSAPNSGDDYLIHSISYDKTETVSSPLIVEEEDSVAFSIASVLTDVDGSESLKVELTDIPIGFTISDDTNSFTATASTTSVDITNWDKSTLTLMTTNVSDTTTYTLKVVSTSTESSNGDVATTTKVIQVTVTDTKPTAVADNDSVGFGGEAHGNVITGDGGLNADILGEDSVELSSITYGGTTYLFNGNNTITINGAYGELIINKDGSYSYESTQSNPIDGVSEGFSYTIIDSDGDSSSAILTINHDKDLTPVNDTAIVNESGLSDGTNAGAPTEIVTGNLLDNDNGVGANSSITEISSSVDSDNSTQGNGILTIDTEHGSITVYTKDSNSHRAGDYEYELTDASSGDNIVDSITYRTDDGDGTQSTATLNVSIVDDAPIGTNINEALHDTSGDSLTTNLIIVLDRSGSMGWDIDGNKSDNSDFDADQVRMDIAKDALKSMFGSYDNLGNVNIKFVDFSSDVNESAWYNDDVNSANTYLDGIDAGGGTRYDSALNGVIDGHTQPVADKTLVYFISDGEPNSGHAVDDTVVYGGLTGKAAWENFLDDNGVDISYGIGITNGVSLSSLEPVAYSSTDGNTEPYAIKVLNAFDLKQTLLDSVSEGVVQGDASALIGNGSDGIVLGADGGSITSVVYNGVTYSSTSGDTVSITTTHGGILDINFSTGKYIYTINSNESISGEKDTFSVTATDGDGDTKTVDLVITLDYVAELDANRDYVVTNTTDDLVIDASLLTHNDSGTNSIDSVDGTNVTFANNEVTLSNNANAFEYTVSNPGSSDTAKVEVSYETGTTLSGTDKAETLIGSANDDRIVLGGNDIAVDGAAGLDTLILENGVDLDFSDTNIASIINVEKIDMTDNGAHTISNLSLDDILDMTEPGNSLEIIGDSDDKIEDLDTAGWTETGDTTDNVFEYSRANADGSSDSITLTIDEQIDTTGM
ncbi:hypothetical protein [Sulfurimonas sp.]|uniref:beta strand repeat-containing protein n=1 Tax=Sulfurimonas sp. TaxID=2022749 RepID=UPI002AB2A76C|nr:hypothetical protein [Sulfurimonas sp.]